MPDTVLLVEDEAAIADTLLYALETEGFRIIWRRLVSEAMASLEEEHVDLVLLDIGLPDGNGFDLCRDIRRQHAVPIIFLTARKEEIDRVVGLEIGGDDYVTKPFSPREVTARVKAVLRRVRPEASPSGDSGGAQGVFSLDDAGKRIAYQGQWLELSRYEYRILHALASHPERVLSREQLMDHAWEEPEASFDRAVDTHIKTLRSKLRQIDPEGQPIRTHRGMGYSVTLKP